MGVRRRPLRGHRFIESPVLQLALQGWRSRTVGLLLMAAFLALVARGFYLQVINNDFLQEKGDSRYRRDIEVSASRGKIIDRNGDMLAVSTPMKSIWAIPGDARVMPLTQKQQLAALLEMDVRELDGKLASDKTFVFVKRQVPPETAERIAALKLPGVHNEKEYRRYYPTGDMTAHIVGFTGVDDKGLEGVELAFQQSLLGRSGSRTVIRDRRGNIVEDVVQQSRHRMARKFAWRSIRRFSIWPIAISRRRLKAIMPRPAAPSLSMRAMAKSWLWPTGRPITRTTGITCLVPSCAIGRLPTPSSRGR